MNLRLEVVADAFKISSVPDLSASALNRSMTLLNFIRHLRADFTKSRTGYTSDLIRTRGFNVSWVEFLYDACIRCFY